MPAVFCGGACQVVSCPEPGPAPASPVLMPPTAELLAVTSSLLGWQVRPPPSRLAARPPGPHRAGNACSGHLAWRGHPCRSWLRYRSCNERRRATLADAARVPARRCARGGRNRGGGAVGRCGRERRDGRCCSAQGAQLRPGHRPARRLLPHGRVAATAAAASICARHGRATSSHASSNSLVCGEGESLHSGVHGVGGVHRCSSTAAAAAGAPERAAGGRAASRNHGRARSKQLGATRGRTRPRLSLVSPGARGRCSSSRGARRLAPHAAVELPSRGGAAAAGPAS
jgi:hypothetical protein